MISITFFFPLTYRETYQISNSYSIQNITEIVIESVCEEHIVTVHMYGNKQTVSRRKDSTTGLFSVESVFSVSPPTSSELVCLINSDI